MRAAMKDDAMKNGEEYLARTYERTMKKEKEREREKERGRVWIVYTITVIYCGKCFSYFYVFHAILFLLIIRFTR